MRGVKSYRALDDGQLLRLVAEQDAAALEALYERYGRVAWSLARAMLTDEARAEEVVREAFLALWREAGSLHAVAGTAAPHPLTLTHRRLLEAVRRAEHLRRHRSAASALAFRTSGRGSDGEAAARRAEVRDLLLGLPAPEREVLALAYFGGYTQREVARLVGASPEAVRARMAAAMRRLGGALRDSVQEEPWAPR